MKKLFSLVLVLLCMLNLAGCVDKQDGAADARALENDVVSFSAKVLEVNESYLLVEPIDGCNERSIADKIELPLAGKTSWPVPVEGDTVNVFYSGAIAETYPARITNLCRVEIEVFSSDTEIYSEIPGYTLHVVDIIDTTKQEQCDCAGTIEKFYEDELNEYYFDCIKSDYIMVMDNTGGTTGVVSALNEGFITIDSLDYYGIEYLTVPKSGVSEPEAYMFEAQYIRTDGFSAEMVYPYHVVINSKEELISYYKANKTLYDLERRDKVYSDSTIGFLDACDKYDDSYFDGRNIVFIILQEGSGSIRHEITDVRPRRDENGTHIGWDIRVKSIVPEAMTDDMAQWHLFLEVQMGDVIMEEDAVWINGELSHGTIEYPIID